MYEGWIVMMEEWALLLEGKWLLGWRWLLVIFP